MKIKEWYMSAFPTDELGCEMNDNVTFGDLLLILYKHEDIYTLLNVCDSIVRERVFGELSEQMNVDYKYVYDKWLESV